MLVLSRKPGEEIVIGDNIRVTIVAIHGKSVRLGFTAPHDVAIYRTELHSPDKAFAHLECRSGGNDASLPDY